MNLPHFFVSPNQISEGMVCLSGTDAVHVARVLRLGVGERIVLSDGKGKSYLAVLERVDKKDVSCKIEKEFAAAPPDLPKVTLVQGIPKGDKMDFIVQKGTELGLNGLIPLLSERVVVKLEGDKQLKRWERWRRIALEAAKQCRRPDIPEISRPESWEQVLSALPAEAAALIPWEEEKSDSLKGFLRHEKPPVEIYVFIGPEGGFSSGEVECARLHGVRPVTIGPRILRTETAGLAVLTMILYQWGDLGG
ncbi:16S rRNA (uracil(1498)-N(3))-methyltransferase [Pelotomaculum isophthalicicum JI]|uniref:Ribosomal RNA small subunit methyltransferase E n=1 Tax=Pelotomaculum isophthalicicum JI TaxID=947010 RepID=A0A9X4H8V7_9FIRM|nr:16S rRNA (uracil(1498)-N(3))-methyltransferase [Pelotomaculum isophthalicicum]MDF9409289.1 16S rRNA (uracil(1498)-N(3))-methyltransferase [Pelotomaculum isophthalicicum JI]